MTIREALEKGSIFLKTKNIDSPKLKTRMVMQYVLNKPRQFIIANDDTKLTSIQEEKFMQAITKISKGIPIEHVTHLKEFMKMNFFVNENVLIPRQDTEILAEEAIKIANKINAKKILDLCTGSGVLAVSLAKYIENSRNYSCRYKQRGIESCQEKCKNK